VPGREPTSELAAAARLHALAVEQFNAGNPARSTRTLRRALALLTARERRDDVRAADLLTARCWISLALNEAEMFGAERGLATLAEAQRLLDHWSDPELQVLLHCQRGVIEMRRRRLDVALAEFDAAHTMLFSVSARDRTAVLLNRGTLHLFTGDLASARADLNRSADLAHEIGELVREFKARHNLGYLEFLAGNLPLSLQLMDEVSNLNAPISRGVWLLDRARVLSESGLAKEADDTLAEAVQTFTKEGRRHDLAEAVLERARCALLAGDTAVARRFAGQARAQFRRRGNDRWRRSAELVLLQANLAAGRAAGRLVEPALRLRRELVNEGLRLPARTAGLIAAEAYLRSGNPAAAGALVVEVGPAGRRDPISARLHTRHVRARLDAARGDRARAAREVRAGLRELSAYQASFGSVDLQTASAIHGRRLAEFGLSLALSRGRPAEVLAAAERARAVSTRLPAVRPPEDEAVADLLTELRQTVESLRPVAQDRAASEPLLRRRRELERAIAARGWTQAGAGAARPIAGLPEIRAGLTAADAVMVVLAEASGALHAVVIDADRLRLHDLGSSAAVTEQVRRVRADLDVLAQPRLPGGLRAAVQASFDRSAAELDAALVAPSGIAGRRVVIVSTGVLGQLPWGALPSLRGVPVVVSPSATAWLTATTASAGHRRPLMAAFAGPDLPRAGHEAAGVAAAWANATAYDGDRANRPALARALARGTVVHVAAHGVHQTENPLFSSVRLADGVMFAHELDQAARTPEHVVLSACELGLATVRPGDEALGLTSVLLHLGTRSVVAGVARVGDDIAAETMIAYHQCLSAGQDSAAALADATSALGPRSTAPFVCFGASWRAPT
jgi:tetratricopeptide (TPR) repeat protein